MRMVIARDRTKSNGNYFRWAHRVRFKGESIFPNPNDEPEHSRLFVLHLSLTLGLGIRALH